VIFIRTNIYLDNEYFSRCSYPSPSKKFIAMNLTTTLTDRGSKWVGRTIGLTLGLLVLPLGIMVLPIAAQAQGTSFYPYPTDSPVADLIPPVPFPAALEKTLINQVATASGRPTSDFKIGSAQHGVWSDGCLGVYVPDQGCTMATVPGWKVVVTDDQNRWTYHIGQPNPGQPNSGDIRFNPSESSPLNAVAPTLRQIGDQNSTQSVPEPGLLMGLVLAGTIALGRKGKRDRA
jgi:hypothetical protein